MPDPQVSEDAVTAMVAAFDSFDCPQPHDPDAPGYPNADWRYALEAAAPLIRAELIARIEGLKIGEQFIEDRSYNQGLDRAIRAIEEGSHEE